MSIRILPSVPSLPVYLARLFVTGLSVSLLAGCVMGPEYVEPEVDPPAEFRTVGPATSSAAETSPPVTRETWWDIFDDPALDELLRRVRDENREAAAAVDRLDQARARIGLARAAGRPDVYAAPSFQRQRFSGAADATFGGTVSLYSVPVAASWEPDLFGRIQRGREAALAEAQAAEDDFFALLLLLESEAAGAYFDLRTLDLEISLLERSLGLQRDSLDLVKRRFELGVVDELDVARARTLLAQNEAELFGLRRQRAETVNALAVLVGEAAPRFALESSPIAGEPPAVPAGVPSELLRARPDLRAAERRLAAESARIGIAEAAFFPSLVISGDVGWAASEAGDLFQAASRIWSILPRLTVPIFRRGENRANLEIARARYEEAHDLYEQAVLVAFAEVETALAGLDLLDEQTAAQARAVEAAARARELSRIKYEGGIADYLAVLDAERTALDTERQLARLRGRAFLDTLTLIRALGGRW